MPINYATTKQIAEKIVRREQQMVTYPDNDAFVDRVIEVKILLDRIARQNGADPQFLTNGEPEAVETTYRVLHEEVSA